MRSARFTDPKSGVSLAPDERTGPAKAPDVDVDATIEIDPRGDEREIDPLDDLAPIEGDDTPLGGELTLPDSVGDGDPYDDLLAADAIAPDLLETNESENILGDDDRQRGEIDELDIPNDEPLDPQGDREGPAEDDPDLVPLDVVELDDDQDGLAEESTLDDPDTTGAASEGEPTHDPDA